MAIRGVPLRSSMSNSEQRSIYVCRNGLASGRPIRSLLEAMSIRRSVMLLSFIVAVPILQLGARSQALSSSGDSSGPTATTTSGQLDPIYVRPTQKTGVNNYLFDAFGPYPAVGAAVAAGINQWTNSPPEWNQGAAGFSRRFGSDFGIAALPSARQRVMGWHKHSERIRCITAASAKDSSRACAMLCYRL